MTPLETPAQPPLEPPKRRTVSRSLLVIVSLAVLCLALAVTAVVFALNRSSTTAKAAPNVPVIENIPQPNAACTPAADRKLGLGDDLSQIQWFGWMDGKQMDMPVGQALSQRIAGHDVRDAWYCPPRADWK